MTAAQPWIRQSGTGPRVLWLGAELMEVLVDSAATGGQLSVVRFEAVGQGCGAPPHTHTREDETVVVLDGSVTFNCGATEATIGPGGALFMPRSIRHAFRLATPRALMLLLFTPAGLEHMFLEGGEPATPTTVPRPAAGPPPPDAIAKLVARCQRYGCEVAAPGSAS